ncbi:MAG: ADOP family duplicated permease [Terriglobales bacterium]
MSLRWLLSRRRFERDMESEMQSHLALRRDDLERQGLSASAACRQAQLEFGALDKAKEEGRAARGLRLWDEFGQDLRFGSRMLRKNPGYAAAAVLTLALGIGACAAVFTLVQSVLLRPAPIRDPNQVVVIWDTVAARGISRLGPSGLDYLAWRAQSRSFQDLVLIEHGTGTITGDGTAPLQAAGLRVTPNFTSFFGIQPVLGRNFGPAEWRSQRHVLLLGYRFWQQRYGSSASVIGRGMDLNGVAYTIIGVLPPGINTLFNIDIVAPFDQAWVRRASGDLGVLGRLKPGVTLTQASAEMSGIMRRLALTRPDRRGFGTVLVPLHEVRVQYIQPALWMLLGAVGFVLLIACTNVAILMLGRVSNRQSEFALRRALGATHARLARQCLVESAWLALLGGAGGWLIASGAIRLLLAVLPSSIPVPNGASRIPLPPIHMGGPVLAFTVGIALLTLLLGLAPAVASRGAALNRALRSGPKTKRAAGNLRGRFVAIEAALAVLLLIGAGQMIVGFHRLLGVNLGVRTHDIVTLRIKLANDAPNSPYKIARNQGQEFHAFLQRVRRLPGVQSAGLTEIIPLSQDDMDRYTFVVQGAPPLAPGVSNPANFRGISSGFIKTMGIPLLAGRAFTEADNADHPKVVLIDAALERLYFTGQNPIGKYLQFSGPSGIPREIVGVVGSVRDLGYAQAPVPTIYYPYLQAPMQSMGLVVRTSLPMATILPALKSAIWSVDPNQAVFSPRTMNDIIAGMTSAQRLAIVLLDCFAGLALAMMITGIYSVVAYSVSRRTKEIGVRMALGAGPKDVMNSVLRQGLHFALPGATIGALAALVLLHFLAHLVFGLQPPGALVPLAAVALACVIALAASAFPARRAMAVDPVQALRRE